MLEWLTDQKTYNIQNTVVNPFLQKLGHLALSPGLVKKQLQVTPVLWASISPSVKLVGSRNFVPLMHDARCMFYQGEQAAESGWEFAILLALGPHQRPPCGAGGHGRVSSRGPILPPWPLPLRHSPDRL